MTSEFENRNSERISFLRQIKFGTNNQHFKGKSLNISKGGILINSYKAFIPGTNLSVRIFLDNDVFDLNGKVIWVSKENDGLGSNMGVKFESKTDDLKELYLQIKEIFGEGNSLKH